jgi:long-chain acyl-CoA synthetase
MRALVSEIIESANRRASSSESVKKFCILERDFRPDSDEVTPTMKPKRDMAARNFETVLRSLYT